MKKQQPYRIGVDARPLSTGISGVGRLIAETIKEFPRPEEYEFILFSHKPVHPEHKDLLKKANVQWITGQGLLAKKGALYFNLYLPPRLKQYRLDLFWGAQQVIPPFLDKGIKVVLTYLDFVLYLYPETMRKIAALQQKMFQTLSIRRADHIIGISNQTRDDLVRLFNYPPAKVSVAYPGYNPEIVKNLDSNSETARTLQLPPKYFLSVSTIEPRKNYPFLLKAYQQYRKIAGAEKIPWIIAGRTGWEKKEFIDELNEESRKYQDIILFKSPSDMELQHLYKKSRVFLFASLYEGFGIPLLEALSYKKPALVSDIPTFHEIGKDMIHYLPTDSPEKWAEKMLVLQRKEFKLNPDLSEFTWKKSAVHIEGIFRQILENRNL